MREVRAIVYSVSRGSGFRAWPLTSLRRAKHVRTLANLYALRLTHTWETFKVAELLAPVAAGALSASSDPVVASYNDIIIRHYAHRAIQIACRHRIIISYVKFADCSSFVSEGAMMLRLSMQQRAGSAVLRTLPILQP